MNEATARNQLTRGVPKWERCMGIVSCRRERGEGRGGGRAFGNADGNRDYRILSGV
jgi:hypothetical protein